MAKGITVPVVQSGLEASIEAAAKKAGPLTLSATVDPSSFKRLAQPLGRVSGLATEFEKSIAASNARVIAFGASVGIINGVQNAFASLVKTTIEVEKSLTNIAVISGKTVDELQPFSRALFEIAKNTAQSFQTASEAALEFSRQGLGLEETLKRTQDALTLTRFTTLSAAEAVDVLTAAANSFGATGITTSEILNKLVAVDTKFAVSAEDLAKGLSRAGSIAQEVGVNFDELNAIVTIAQERTARGGAVIGNAFKTIFTRIRSDETIQALQSIGIYSFDAEGRLKPVVGLLEELAGKINTLGETKRIEVLEAIASKYNINVLTALVDDLGSTASKFREARDVSAGAQSEAYQRQIELNQTLDAVIIRVTNSAAQLADTLGRIGVTDSLKSLLNFFDNILTGINDVIDSNNFLIDSEGIGGTIAKGLISGLSGVFFKIGIPLLLAIFVKLTRDIAQFGVESLKTILGINKEVRERQALEQAVVNTLIKDQQVMASILSLSGDRRKQEEYLLSVYNRQLASLQQVQSIAANVAPALQAAGLSATSGTVKKRAAGGYLPAEEAKDVRRGVGGASPSSKVVEIPNFSFGGGKRGTMVANTSEYIVPNYANGSGTAIFNQDMVKQYGLPPGAKKITASGGFIPASGFVPNFAEAKFNIQNPRKRVAKENESKSVITNIDLDNMLPSAYLTISNNPDTSPVGVFSSLQEAAKQKLQEKLGQPIDPSARVEGENIEIKKIQNSYASGGQLIGSIIDAQRKIQSGKANVKKESEVIVNRIIPETSGPLDDNLRKTLVARVENEIKTANSPFFAAGNILEDVLFASTEGDLQDRNSRSWDLPKNISPNFKKAFNLKSDFADVKLGKTERSMSSFLGKHIMAPSGTNASRGYVPNFARYVYDADRVDADKNNLLKAILASRVKKNLIVGPAGSGKSTYGESLGSFITNIAQLTDASEIDILSGAARTKDGGVSKNFQQISDAVNASGGKISYLYTGNMDILSSRTGRIAEGPKQGDLRSKKQIVGTMFAPLNQFDFISKVKGSAKNFEMIRGAKGYIPNFAEDEEDEDTGKKPKKVKKIDRKKYFGSRAIVSAEGVAGMLVPDQANQATMTDYLRKNPWGFQTKEDVYLNDADKSLITNVRYNTYGLKEGAFEGERLKKSGSQTLIEADVEKVGVEIAKKWAAKYSDEYAKKMPGAPAKANFDSEFIGRSFLRSEGAVSAISTLGGGIFESSIRAALDTQVGQRIEKAKKEDANNRLDFPVNPFIKQLFGIEGGEQFVDAKISGNPGSTGRKLADQIVAAGLYKPVKTVKTAAAEGYIPNFADNEPLNEAINREVGAGVSPARVRVTQDGRLKNPKNPNGLAVINTRDEPNGKIPNDFRERGMRAAMASRGFVPNFAEENVGVNVKGIFTGKTKKFDESINKLAEATNNALLEYKQNKINLEQLNKAINASKVELTELVKAQKLTADVETKYAQTVNEGIKKIDEKKKVKDGQQNTTATTGGGATRGGAFDKLGKIDIGKFILLQSAVVGVTSALQSATEQGSALGNSLEVTSAAVSGAATSLSLLKSGLGPIGIVAAGVVTALTQLTPLFIRLYEAQKTQAERTAEALAKLGKEAERTGRKLSAEEILATFQQQEKVSTETKKKGGAEKQIETFIKGTSADTQDNKNLLFGVLNSLDAIDKQGKINEDVLKSLFKGSFSISQTQGPLGIKGDLTPKFDFNQVLKNVREKVTEKRLADVRKPETEDRTDKTIKAENELLKIKFNILNGIVKKELEINTVYADRIRTINSESTALQRSQTIITERAYAEIQASQERQKVQAEEAKAISENANNLRSSLAGLQDQGLGNIFGEADTEKLQGLLQAFSAGGGGIGSDAFKKAFEASTARTQDGKPVAGINIAQLSAKTQEDIYKNLNDATNNEARARSNAANRINDINKTEKDFQSSLERITDETNQLNAIIAESDFYVQTLNKTYSGTEKYQELINTEQAKLVNSLSKGILQNKISLDSAKTSFEVETRLLKAKLDLEQGIRNRIPIEERAAKDAIELNRSTLERIDQLKKDAINAPKRLQSQKDILSAETGVIESENAVGGGGVDLERVLLLRRNSIAKLTQSERAAEEETRANIGMMRKKVDADRASVDRQTRTIEAEEDLYKNGIDLANVVSIRRSMVAKLTQSERKAEEETLASIGMMRQKMDAERAGIDRQTRLTEEENRIYNSNDKDLNIAALRRSTLAKLEQSERKAEEENQAAIKTVNEKYKADLDGIKRQAELTEAQNAAVDASKQSTAIAVGLRLARAKLVESERKAEEENQIAIRMIGQSYEADISSTKRKLEYAQALNRQISQAKINEKVTGEMNLETENLITSLREAQAKFNNINIEVGNEALRARTNVLGETTSTISRGLALSNLRIGGELETQAFAQVAEQRRGGREAEDISTSELYDINKGRNLSVRQGLSIQKAALLDEAQTFQDIIGKSTPKLFADGMAEAMQAALNQADDLGGALRNVALTFLKNLQSAFLQSASRQIVASILPNAVPTGKEGGYVVKGYASGGLVTGGSGYKDDVPAMLSEGEYVIRKSSVNKYGTSNLQKLNSGEAPKFADGGIFLPGVRGQGQISGYKDLTAFAKQTTTSGATDVLTGGATTAFASLEDQSSKLSAYALMNEDDTINQEIRSAQEQAMNIIAEREAYRTAERKAFQKQLVGTVASAALSFGIGKATGALFGPKSGVGVPNLGFNSADVASKITQPAIPTPNMLSAPIKTTSTSFGDFMSPARAQAPSYSSLLSMFQPQGQYPVLQGSSPFAMPRPPGRAYGGVVKRYNAGGGPTDDIPALLMGGEYVMNRQATKKYGRQFFDSINQGRAPRFADGGNVSTAEPSFAEKAASSSDSKATGATNVSININVTGGTSDTQTQGDTKQGGVDYKKMSEQIKQVVIQTINEEKRLGGSLRPRG